MDPVWQKALVAGLPQVSVAHTAMGSTTALALLAQCVHGVSNCEEVLCNTAAVTLQHCNRYSAKL